jgi:heme/copper-type cytochrome/quinol oxidase subunit 2
MRGRVVIEAENDYNAWLQKQKTFAQISAPAKSKLASNARNPD